MINSNLVGCRNGSTLMAEAVKTLSPRACQSDNVLTNEYIRLISRPQHYTSDVPRRTIIVALASAAALMSGGVVPAAQAARVYRIGILETLPADQNRANFSALLSGLREHGYIEGQNLQIEYRSADGRADRFPPLAAELVRLPLDLIVTRGTPATKAAKEATDTIPIVFTAIGEPVGAGVIPTLARPGGNVTGLSAFATELAGKRMELLKEAFPAIARLGFMHNMGNPVAPPEWEAVKPAAKVLGISVELFDIRREPDITAAFKNMRQHNVDALYVGIDALTQANAKMIVDLAAEQKLPTVYIAREYVNVGGLLSYGPSFPDLYRRAAGLIDKIFKGAKPGDVPVEQPTKLELIINLKTAKALGVEIPPGLMVRADEVIE
jgi:putative tryptophan/tyrosine transport system substrate-binding protein